MTEKRARFQEEGFERLKAGFFGFYAADSFREGSECHRKKRRVSRMNSGIRIPSDHPM